MGLGVAMLALALILAALPAVAQTDVDDVLEGFEEEPAEAEPEPEDKEARFLPSWLALGGGISQDLSVNFAHGRPAPGETDHRGLSGLRSRLDLAAEVTLGENWRARATGYAFYDWAYRARGRGDFTDRFLDEYEWDAELGEAYLRGRLLPDLDVKVGRQIVVWGKSDSIRVTDILNPLDLRLPGRTDIEDLRRPVAMTRLDYYLGAWSLTGIVLHEPRFDRTPVFGSDFFPGAAPLPPADQPGPNLENQQAAVAVNGTFTGWDMALYGAWVFDNRAHLAATPAGPRRRFSRLLMAGAAANAAFGDWLIKGEAAYLHGLEFFNAPGERFARLDALLGVEYAGFADTTIALELADRHLFDADPRLRQPPDDGRRDDPEAALRVTRKFLHETLDVTLLVAVFGLRADNGGFARTQLDYDLTDAVELSAGAVFYQSGDKQAFQGIGDNDRVFFRVEYRF